LQTADGGYVLAGTKNSYTSNQAGETWSYIDGNSDIWLMKIPPYTPSFSASGIFDLFLLGGLGALIGIILFLSEM